jgi:hypothetical protein
MESITLIGCTRSSQPVRDEREKTTHPDTLGSEQHLVRHTNKMASCRVHSRKKQEVIRMQWTVQGGVVKIR